MTESSAPAIMQPRPFESLYIHVPFCARRKCDYCAFYSLPGAARNCRRRYLERLAEEAAGQASQATILRSVFIGGGTPSVLTSLEIRRLGQIIRNNFTLAPDCEFTFEANPDSLSLPKIDSMIAAGANRFSLGIQSFNPHFRRIIGRRTSLKHLEEIIRHFRQCRVPDLNFDLIFNIPGQTLDDWEQDLRSALAFQPTHLSAYSLIFEPGTPLARRLEPPDNDDMFLSSWRATDRILATAGLHRYEISNFARKGHHCRHNYDVWHGVTYLGLGPAAVSFNGINRPANPSSLTDWLDHVPPADDIIPPPHRLAEILAFGLRTTDGWNLLDFQKLTGMTLPDQITRALRRLADLKLLKIAGNTVRPTARGLRFNDYILETILGTAL